MQREARMKRELKLLECDPPPGISCWMVDDHIDHLHANVLGAEGTPYSEGIFKLDIYIHESIQYSDGKSPTVNTTLCPHLEKCFQLLGKVKQRYEEKKY